MGRKPKSADSAGKSMGVSASKAERKFMEAVAKHMRSKVPTKSALIKGQKVEYFPGSKAIDCLMNSKWTAEPKSPDSEEPHFVNRTFAADYCNKLLREVFFVRAEKVDLKHVDTNNLEDENSGGSKESKGSTTLRKRGAGEKGSPRPKKQGEEGEKKKRKFRLDIHKQQVFMDTKEDVYFWKYDPPSYTSYFVGLAVVIGAVAMTLQPLWPDSSREALWYISICVFVLMGVMVALIVIRWAVFGLAFGLTGGKLKFWILPNLDNEKTGFFESFKPLLSSTWVKEKKKKRKKEESSSLVEDVEETKEESQTKDKSEVKNASQREEEEEEEEEEGTVSGNEGRESEAASGSGEESGTEENGKEQIGEKEQPSEQPISVN